MLNVRGGKSSMSYRGREIESKWLVPNTTLEEVSRLLSRVVNMEKNILIGQSKDMYWTIGNGRKGQFLRLRDTGNVRQITVKARDRETPNDRMELEVESTQSMHLINRLITCVMGKANASLTKTYHIFFLENGATVSVYRVDGLPHTVVEIEARSTEELHKLNAQYIPLLFDHYLGTYEAAGSLYEMLVSKEVPI